MPKDKPSADPQFLSRIHAAARIDVDPQTIDKLRKRGQLNSYRLGKKVLIRTEELLRLVESGRSND